MKITWDYLLPLNSPLIHKVKVFMLRRLFIVFFLLILIFLANAFANPIPQRKFDPDFKPTYGVSYSFEQASWYGLNPRDSYTKLLDEFKFKWVRLPFFWNLMIDSQGNLKIDDLKFAIEEANKRNVKVIIALGAKTPYYPEYHWPENIASQVKFAERITLDHPVAEEILAIDKKVVSELSAYDNIAYWQVENEPLVGNVNKWKIDPSLVAAEVEIVRKTDSQKRPIVLNHAATGFYDKSWKELLPILKPGDVFAVNAFFKTKGTDLISAKIFGREIHILWPDHLVWPVHSWWIFSPNYQTIKETVEANGNKLWILEMQSEPYIKKIEQADDPFLTFTPQDIITGNNFLKSYQIESIGLWGAHFWQYQQKKGNPAWVDTAKSVVNN